MDEKGGKTGKNGGKRGKTGKNGEKRGGNGGETGGKWGTMGTVMNGSSCSGLFHCHYFLYAYPCLCCSHLHTDMMIFFLLCASPFGAGMPNPGERLGFNLVCKKCSPQNSKRGGGQNSGGWVLSKIRPPDFPRFPPVFPPFSPVFPPFFPVFPRSSPFFPATGNQTPIGYGNLGPLTSWNGWVPPTWPYLTFPLVFPAQFT